MPKSYWTKIQTPDGHKYFRADEVTDELLQKIKNAANDVFCAEYNVTPFSDIKAAYEAGKKVFAFKTSGTFTPVTTVYELTTHIYTPSLPEYINEEFIFSSIRQGTEKTIYCYPHQWGEMPNYTYADSVNLWRLKESVAKEYNTIPCPILAGTYATKDYVLYKANTEITSESTYATWDDSQWDRVTVGDELKELESSSKIALFECRDNGTEQNFFTGPTYDELEAARGAGKTIVLLVHGSMDTVADKYFMLTSFSFGRGYFAYRFTNSNDGSVLKLEGPVASIEYHAWSRGTAYDNAISSTSANAVQNKTLYAIINDLQTRVAALEGNQIAPEYSSTSTYDVGDLVYNGGLYRCTTAISTPENWNSAHWTQTTVDDEVKLKAEKALYESNYTQGYFTHITFDMLNNLSNSNQAIAIVKRNSPYGMVRHVYYLDSTGGGHMGQPYTWTFKRLDGTGYMATQDSNETTGLRWEALS